jgi:hypothetical protein
LAFYFLQQHIPATLSREMRIELLMTARDALLAGRHSGRCGALSLAGT